MSECVCVWIMMIMMQREMRVVQHFSVEHNLHAFARLAIGRCNYIQRWMVWHKQPRPGVSRSFFAAPPNKEASVVLLFSLFAFFFRRTHQTTRLAQFRHNRSNLISCGPISSAWRTTFGTWLRLRKCCSAINGCCATQDDDAWSMCEVAERVWQFRSTMAPLGWLCCHCDVRGIFA